MREYHLVGVDIEKFLQKKLESFDGEHIELADHYGEIKRLFESGSYSKILASIETGLVKFGEASNSLRKEGEKSKFNPEYCSYLLELKNILFEVAGIFRQESHV